MKHARASLLFVLLSACDSSGQGVGDADAAQTPFDDAGPDGSLPDAGSAPTTAEDCFADLSAPSSGFIAIQRFRSADAGVEVWRARQTIDGPTVGETFAFALTRFWIESDGEPGTCVRAKSALDYEYAHHNWNESWSARTAQADYEATEVFSVEATDGDRWQDTLSARSADGKLLWGPVALVQDGCSSLPYDLNACPSRTRIDTPPPGWGSE